MATGGGTKMRELTNFYQVCVYICIVMIIFNLCVSFVSGLGVFPYDVDSGIEAGPNSNDTYTNLTDLGGFNNEGFTGMDGLWIIFLGSGATLIIGLFLVLLTRSTNILGIVLFSGVFWSSYISSFSIINVGGFLNDLPGFVLIGTVGMLFIFSAAVIGMLSGS